MADYYVSSTSGALLRRDGGSDDVFRDGGWYPTQTIGRYMVGRDNDVDEVSEAQARASYPAAFASSSGAGDGEPQWLADGGLRVPHGWTDPETGTLFDGMVTVYPGDPLYEAWVKYLAGQ